MARLARRYNRWPEIAGEGAGTACRAPTRHKESSRSRLWLHVELDDVVGGAAGHGELAEIGGGEAFV
jgi:hypothetical protein